MRNRTMALIVHASVIVEAGDKSGAISQGWETLRLGRPLFIHRSLLENPSVSWPKEMMDYGAVALNKPSEVLTLLPAPGMPLDADAL